MNRLVRARVLVVATFLFATVVQGYSLFTLRGGPSPDYAVYVPNPYFLMAFFAIQTGLQFYWILQLFQRSVREARSAPLLDDEVEMQTETNYSSGEPAQMAYVPLYSLANVFLVGSKIAWQFSQFSASQICMAFSTACHLYFIFFALNPSGRHAWTPKNRLTHLVAKTSAGVALLYMWRAWGVMEIGPFRPAIQQQAHCGVLVLLLAFASGPDPTLGICLLFDLAALAAGDTTKDEWKFAFSCIMGVLSVVIVSDCILSRRASQNGGVQSYSRTDDSEDEESALHQDGSEEIFLADLTTLTEGDYRV